MKSFKEIREGAENYTVKKGPYTRKVDGKTADKMKKQGWELVAREEVEEARQMKDPKKDSMVHKDGKTIVIDKSKEKEYLKKGWSLAESTELSEATVSRSDFEKLKKGMRIEIDFGSSISSSQKRVFTVKSTSRSAKYNVDKINMTIDGKGKYHLYSRGGKDATLALGNMAATIKSYKILGTNESLDEDSSGMTSAQKKKFDVLYKKMDGGKEHRAIRQKIHNPIKADDAFHALVKKMAMEGVDLSEAVDFEKMSNELLKKKKLGIEFEKAAAFARVMFMNSSLSVQDKAMKGLLTLLKGIDDLTVKTTLIKILKDNGFKVKGGRVMRESVNLEEGKMKEFHDYIAQGKSAQWIAKKMGLDMKTVKELMADMKESVELDEAYQQFLDKTPNWGEDKAISYGRKKGYKEIGVCGHGKIDGIVLFGMDAGDKAYVGKEAKVKTGQTVFRYATKRTVAGDIFPLVKIDVKRGILYNLSQKSSEGEIEHAEFETKGVKLRYLRLLASANLRDITGFDPGFGSMKESTAPKTLSDTRAER